MKKFLIILNFISVGFLAVGFGNLAFAQSSPAKTTGKNTAKKTKVIQIPGPERRVSLGIAQLSATIVATIKGSSNNKSSKENSFDGLKDCSVTNLTSPVLEATGKCFEFRAGTKDSDLISVPVVIVNATGEKAFEDLTKQKAKQAGKQDYGWGVVYTWATPGKGASHYIYLSPNEKQHMIRIGPMPRSVYVQHNIEWNVEPW